ncbi:MAG: cofactor-independent phosphoglycerate mutase [Spirochaetes bacterium ADurb.Bin218]|jgi:2,3-bisphosphoglycerate-independent phosphoglycerate mutase|nr:MAG: cofactor-independent phosphoglycerate mutase [Spirochaetes bacterium ADurb.Bin218]HOQ12241.1 cofactor-independent phosphoglycerate mutase [Spirochaetota bacterium]HOV07592.1 cofactor-independent phosphoglycerate mutase [Spirochaetota bacterium]HPX90772.1 cofactor-independent phosphoglycerate mutase [Spirochaetota bacterium]
MREKTKYVILLGDGMADLPVPELGNKTILEFAKTPNMDFMAKNGICGITQTVPAGMSPGSDTANLSVFGYDPAMYYTGRAPLEALSMDIELAEGDVAFRCNIVDASGGIMNDFTSSHIDSRFTRIVIEELAQNIKIKDIEFYPGVSYRNIVVWRNYPYDNIAQTTPPHDIQTKEVREFLPSGEGSETLKEIMSLSEEIIRSSKKIIDSRGLYKGNPHSVWLWGGGRKPSIEPLSSKYGITGYTISAVDLIHGIGKAAGLSPLFVEGATGYLDTNYKGKVNALAKGIGERDFVFLHVEAPDESGHEGNIEHKLQAIEDFDSKVVGPVLEIMSKYPSFRILLMPDHPTPVKVRTHTGDPVLFCIFSDENSFMEERIKFAARSFDEQSASQTSLFVSKACNLLPIMINGKLS